MPEAPKLCPLSFGFSLKQQIPSILEPKKVDLRIQIGFPCLKEKCDWWDLVIGDCVIWAILDEVKKPSSKRPEAIC